MKITRNEGCWRGGLFLWLLILVVNAGAATYEYDSLNRLTLVRYDATNMIYYTYDTVGNRTSMVRIGPDNPDLDSNGDGVSDRWELNYFGTLDVDLNADPDGDGFSNLQEYLAGTDPTVAASALRITAAERDGADIRVSFTSVSGKYYCLECCDSFGDTWTNIVDNIPGNDGIQQAADAMSVDQPKRFYRVKLITP